MKRFSAAVQVSAYVFQRAVEDAFVLVFEQDE